jgi:acetyltransferase-like isoleucine patch superfamily enzyme
LDDITSSTSFFTKEFHASTNVPPVSNIPVRGKRFPGQGIAPYIKAPLYIDYGAQLEIGASTFINRNCTILDNPIHAISIGERCMIGPNFSIYALGHPVGEYFYFL